MSSREADLVRDYINLYILEKTGNTDGLEVPFQKRLSTKDLKTYNEDETKTKATIENAIQKLMDQKTTQELLSPEIRAQIIDKTYEGLNGTLRNNFNQMIHKSLQGMNKNMSNETLNANLILSEIFMPDTNFGRGFMDEPSNKNQQPLEEDMQIDISQLLKEAKDTRYTITQFEKDVLNLDFTNYNNKKLVGFLEMLDSYNMKVNFATDDLEKTEGLLLKFFYSDEQNLNFYIFKKSVRNFMKNFVSQFMTDIEARFKAFDMVKSPHLVLLATYSPYFCEFLDKQEYIEKVQEQIEDISPTHYHLYIKILINFLNNYPYVVDKMISLRIIDKLSSPILEKNLPRDLSLFAVLLTKASTTKINSKKILARSVGKLLFTKIIEITQTYSDLKVMALKYKNHVSNFHPNISEEPQVVLETYIQDYKDLISQKMPLKRYRYLYYTGLMLLKFIGSCNLKYDNEQRVAFTYNVLDFISVYFYQRNIVNKGFVALKQLLCKENVEIVLDEFLETNLLKNCFGVFERKNFSLKTIKALLNFQALLLSVIEFTHLNGKALHSNQLKKIIDQIYKIRVVVGNFYYEMKKKYLSKGLVKYVHKLKKDLKKNLVQPLDEVLSLNGLILQKLSHTQILDENILFYTGTSDSIFERFREKQKMESLIANSNQLLYIVAKVDRKENYLDRVITYNLFMLDKIEYFINSIQRNKELVDFDFIESIIEYLIINIYFVKTYDEQYKKVSSIKVLKRTVELFVKIMESTRTFIDLQSNHQIYILLENLGLFWLLFFDYNYKFYDRLSFVFIDNLKAAFRETDDNKVETFTPNSLHKILTFLNDFVDLKSKNSFLNFIILKQLDTIQLTLTNITPLNQNFITNIFQKIFTSEYGAEIHRLHPKYMINLNVKTLSMAGVKDHFLNFITNNTLFVNNHMSVLLKNLLEKNFETNKLNFSNPQMSKLFDHTVLGNPLASSPETTQFLLSIIQKNIRNKILFEDLVGVLRKYLKTADATSNNEIVRKLFLSESVFLKLVRLYKKDRVNLSKVLKYLLLICKHFNFLREIKIPKGVIVSLLSTKEISLFHDVYMLVISYILENQMYNDYKQEIDTFLTNTKNYLDGLLYFSSDINYERQIRTIYYSLKVLKNCSVALKNIPEFTDIDNESFILRYILQLMDENSKLEMVPINNLYHHFKKNQQINLNYKTANFERKIVMMFFDILQKNTVLFDSLIQDFFVINKLISFSYIVLDEKVFENYAGLFIRILYYGIKENQKDLFKDVFFDFYLLVYFEFLYESETIEPFVKRHVCENNRLINSSLIRILDEIKRKKYRFDSMGYNIIIRALLKIYYISCSFTDQIFNQEYTEVLLALDTFLYNNYKDIHGLHKLEKLIVSLYIHIHGKAKIKSKNSASVFLYVFNNHVDFKMSSLIDRYIYMGLFNVYFKIEKLYIQYFVDKETGDFSKLADSAQIERLKQENSVCVIEPRKINDVLLQLKLEKLSVDNEIILIKFLEKLNSIDKPKVLQLNYNIEIQEKLIREIIAVMGNYYELELKSFILLKRRINMLLILVSKEISLNSSETTQLLTEAATLCSLIDQIYSSPNFAEKSKEKSHLKFFGKLQKLVYKLYKLASNKNEAYLKPEIMLYMQKTWNSVHSLSNDHESKKILQNQILFAIIKLMRKRYDEMRIVLFKDFIPEILKMFEQYIQDSRRQPKKQDDNNDENVFKLSDATFKASEKEINKTVNFEQSGAEEPYEDRDDPIFNDDNLENLTLSPENYIFSQQADDKATMEKCLYIFYQISRNRLLLDIEFKKNLFSFIDANRYKIASTNLSKILYKLLRVEYFEEAATLNLDATTVKNSVITTQNNQAQQNDLPNSQVFLKKSNPSFKQFNGEQTDKIQNSLIPDQNAENDQQKTEIRNSGLANGEDQKRNQNEQEQVGNQLVPQQEKEKEDKNGTIEELSPLKPIAEEKQKDGNLDNQSKLAGSVVVQKKPKESSLSIKQKNILYVHKVFVTLWKNLEKKEAITPREEEFLSFGLVALQKHLLENLDPEIFNSLSFFALICKFILDDRINTSFKYECLVILRLYLKSCQNKNGIDPNDAKDLLYFYERLFFDNYTEIIQVYFEVVTLIFQYIKFENEYLNKYVDNLSYCLFEAYNSISANVFVPALAVYTRVIIDHRPQLDIPQISGTVYMFLKLNYKDMKLYERALFTQLLAVYDKNGGLDSTKLNNMCLFVKFTNTMDNYDKIEEALTCFEEITNFYEDYQKLFRVIGFEAFYKLVMKKCGDNIQIIRLLSKLFLRYSYKAEENKFEMFEVVKCILKYIVKFYNKSNDEKTVETVILLYKSLVNCSLVKENSDFMVKSDLGRIIIDCSYKNRNECVMVVLSLLFNVCYVFDNGEVNLKKLINEPLLNYISDIFSDVLEQKNDAILMEIIDLFLAFVQHEYTDFFTEAIIAKIKLALNFYYDSSIITIKFLNILQDITLSNNVHVIRLVSNHLDYIYLYHIHYRNFNNNKINFFVKHIIHNCLIHNKEKHTQKHLITYGIPENIIHTFSFDNDRNVIILNLKIILISLEFEKCQYFVKNHFMAMLRELLYGKKNHNEDQIYKLSLDILCSLFKFFKDPQILNFDYYFDDVPMNFAILSFNTGNDAYLSLLLTIIQQNIDADKGKIAQITPANRMLLQELIAQKSKNKDKDVLNLLYQICNLTDVHASFVDRKMNFSRNNALTPEDRILLETGQTILVVYQNKVTNNASIKFDFVRETFEISNFQYTDPVTKASNKSLIFKVSLVQAIDNYDAKEETNLEDILKTYFNKKLKRELFFSLNILFGEKEEFVAKNIFIFFENEYKMQKWKALIEAIISSK